MTQPKKKAWRSLPARSRSQKRGTKEIQASGKRMGIRKALARRGAEAEEKR
jgi:hypothetical protein